MRMNELGERRKKGEQEAIRLTVGRFTGNGVGFAAQGSKFTVEHSGNAPRLKRRAQVNLEIACGELVG